MQFCLSVQDKNGFILNAFGWKRNHQSKLNGKEINCAMHHFYTSVYILNNIFGLLIEAGVGIQLLQFLWIGSAVFVIPWLLEKLVIAHRTLLTSSQ